jgi:hypothetical protein
MRDVEEELDELYVTQDCDEIDDIIDCRKAALHRRSMRIIRDHSRPVYGVRAVLRAWRRRNTLQRPFVSSWPKRWEWKMCEGRFEFVQPVVVAVYPLEMRRVVQSHSNWKGDCMTVLTLTALLILLILAVCKIGPTLVWWSLVCTGKVVSSIGRLSFMASYCALQTVAGAGARILKYALSTCFNWVRNRYC